MRIVVQRVNESNVKVDKKIVGQIKSGNRPSFSDSAKPDLAFPLYEYFVEECKKQISIVQTGIFGSNMKISILNDGPVTIILDS